MTITGEEYSPIKEDMGGMGAILRSGKNHITISYHPFADKDFLVITDPGATRVPGLWYRFWWRVLLGVTITIEENTQPPEAQTHQGG